MGTKQLTILAALRDHSLNRFEAERIGDHCLHSTVAVLRGKGYLIRDDWETVPTRFGITKVKRYFLLAEPKPYPDRSQATAEPYPIPFVRTHANATERKARDGTG